MTATGRPDCAPMACAADADCGDGNGCLQGYCAPLGSDCTADADCPTGNACQAGYCVMTAEARSINVNGSLFTDYEGRSAHVGFGEVDARGDTGSAVYEEVLTVTGGAFDTTFLGVAYADRRYFVDVVADDGDGTMAQTDQMVCDEIRGRPVQSGHALIRVGGPAAA